MTEWPTYKVGLCRCRSLAGHSGCHLAACRLRQTRIRNLHLNLELARTLTRRLSWSSAFCRSREECWSCSSASTSERQPPAPVGVPLPRCRPQQQQHLAVQWAAEQAVRVLAAVGVEGRVARAKRQGRVVDGKLATRKIHRSKILLYYKS